jgi:hypothetical protein
MSATLNRALKPYQTTRIQQTARATEIEEHFPSLPATLFVHPQPVPSTRTLLVPGTLSEETRRQIELKRQHALQKLHAAKAVPANPVLVYNHQSRFASTLRSLSSSFDLTMCPHLPFYGADVLVSYAIAVRLAYPADIVRPEFKAWVQSASQRTEHVYIVLLLDDQQKSTRDAATTLSGVKGVHVRFAQSSLIVGKLLWALTKREESRRTLFAMTQWRLVLWNAKHALEALAAVPGCNALLALAMLVQFGSCDEAAKALTVEGLCKTVTPGLRLVQGAKVVAALKCMINKNHA